MSNAGFEGVLLEGSPFLGDGTTGRNSGVLHAGIYYKNMSLKHRLCIEGNRYWRELADQFSFVINECGKFIVAERIEQEDELDRICENGLLNGVPLVYANSSQLSNLKIFVQVVKAIFSPSSAVIDVPSVVKSISREVQKNGFMISSNTTVERLESRGKGISLFSNRGDFDFDIVINCAGHGGIKIRESLGLDNLSQFPVKGCYLKYNGKLSHPWLIYPLPEKSGHGLGIHNVIYPDGSLGFGPNSQTDCSDGYMVSDDTFASMKKDICSRFKEINSEHLHKDFAGIRPKIMFEGKVFDDFWIKGPRCSNIPGYFEVLGIESPGLTAAPAIGREILNMIRSEVI